ncbi:hypothetical protein ABT390_21550 [Streptomyces aurantiacus]|uniref:Uncharacterized protein n=1 Tax=Streptomyces aurantiacus JA 4570 TaxID=1286094 RepID=S3ZC16_9ACTN|nr:hypothetical protein [Streptomyces aurantiacus]EPH40643.1 hypothetical protein STRAU_6340 [Streptomyces aurantiacus JA 4570]
MSSKLIDPNGIPQFTGNLEQLERDATDLSMEASLFRLGGGQVHSIFQGLSAFYEAPEAEDLFATTKPVATRSDAFADQLEKVAQALNDYATEVRPLAEKLKQLRIEASAFVIDDVSTDDEWRKDQDKVDHNNRLMDDVEAATLAFQAAEIACHNRITALVDGIQLKPSSDGQTSCGTYGYTEEVLDQAEELPWGAKAERDYDGIEWLAHKAVDFGKGVVVDGIVGTVKAIGTLAGKDGWGAAGEAWTNLAKLGTGLALTMSPAAGLFWTAKDEHLPGWLRDSRRAVVETGKGLIAYDQWGKNPARAAGLVSFNAVTIVATRGAGAAVKGGAMAKVVSVTGRVGRGIDPFTYAAKGVTFAVSKVGDLLVPLKNVGAGARVGLADGPYRLVDEGAGMPARPAAVPDDAVRYVDNEGGSVYLTKEGAILDSNGAVLQRSDQARPELSARERATAVRNETPAPRNPAGEPVLAGVKAGDGAAEPVGRAADTSPGNGSHGPGPSGSHASLGGSSVDGVTGLGRAGGGTGGPGDHVPGQPGGRGAGAGGTEPDPKEILRRHVERANSDPSWFKEHYRSNGYRRVTNREFWGQRLPQLVRDPSDPSRWIAKTDLPPAIPAKYVDSNPLTGHRIRLGDDVLGELDKSARLRHDAIAADRQAEQNLADAERAHQKNPTAETEAARDAAESAHSPLHGDQGRQSELFGEAVAERHAIPEHFPNARRVDDGEFGNNRFDQVYRNPDGSFVVVEAKGSLRAGLGERTSHLGNRVQQGTREYFETILREMDKRAKAKNDTAEAALVRDLRNSLKRGSVKYILVKAEAAGNGKYAGYQMKEFNISKPRSK